jgi:hypothetical protein
MLTSAGVRRMAGGLVVSALAAGGVVTLASGTATARTPRAVSDAVSAHAAKCSLKGSSVDDPEITFPCDKGAVKAGSQFTFKVIDKDPNAPKYHPFIYLSKSPKTKNGELKVLNADTMVQPLKRVKHSDVYEFKTNTKPVNEFTFPGYWRVTPGTYYIEIVQPDGTFKYAAAFSPIEKIRVVK